MVKDEHSTIRRGLRIGRMGLGLTGSYLAYQFQNLLLGAADAPARKKSFHSRASRRVREDLEMLKGPAMKMGQLLSLMGHALPPEAGVELARLQGRAPGMHPTLARAQFKGSLGKEPEDLFKEFEEVPFAAASLGQVHRARTRDGQSVAVKIQYPAIRAAIENDFKLLRSATLPGRLSGHVSKGLLDEIEQGFLKETDYLSEAENIRFFQKQFAPLGYVRLPRVIDELTTGRVLTMTLVEGLHADEFLATSPSARLRHLIGHRLAELYHFEVRAIHAFHADPHPGNYLFEKDGTIGLVDFGCVKYCTPEFGELVDALVDRTWLKGEAEYKRITRLFVGRGGSAESKGARVLAKAGIQFYEKIFPTDTPGQMKVDFSDPGLISALTGIWNEALRGKVANPEFAFASRAELGLYCLLHRFGAKVDTARIREHVGELRARKESGE